MTEQHPGQGGYPIWQLVQDVEALLRDKGFEPQIPKGSADVAVRGARDLLNAYGITPQLDQITSMVLSVNEPWPDRDDRRAHAVER